jgi:oxygen-independent coproporphyrinogen III oxidase
MLGETDANWQRCIERTLDLEPDSVTIYQMELPYNTTISGDLLSGSRQFKEPVADWATKRRWVAEAFEALERPATTSAAPTRR